MWLLEKYLLVVLRFDDRIIFRNFVFQRQAVYAQSTLAADRPQTHSKYYFGAKRSGKNTIDIF